MRIKYKTPDVSLIVGAKIINDFLMPHCWIPSLIITYYSHTYIIPYYLLFTAIKANASNTRQQGEIYAGGQNHPHLNESISNVLNRFNLSPPEM